MGSFLNHRGAKSIERVHMAILDGLKPGVGQMLGHRECMNKDGREEDTSKMLRRQEYVRIKHWNKFVQRIRGRDG